MRNIVYAFLLSSLSLTSLGVSVDGAQKVDTLESDISGGRVVRPEYARNTDEPEKVFPILVEVAFQMMFKVTTRLSAGSSGVVEMRQYRLIVDAGATMLEVEQEGIEKNILTASEAFAELAKLSDVYKEKFPDSYESSEVFKMLDTGRSTPSRYINDIITKKTKSMIRSGQIVLSEGGGLDGTAEEHGLSPDVVRLRNQEIEARLRGSDVGKDNISNSSAVDRSIATVVSVDSHGAEPSLDEHIETSSIDSYRWLWLVGLIFSIGGLAVFVCRKK